MKVTVVPAQVTTVEDRIAGSLGLSQLLLLSIPIFGGSLLYIVLPPFMHATGLKLTVMICLLLACSLLAIRIKGKLLLFWLVILLRYNLRPRYYIYNKRSLSGREEYMNANKATNEIKTTEVPKKVRKSLNLSLPELIHLQNLLDNPAAHVRFENGRGGLNVRITEVK